MPCSFLVNGFSCQFHDVYEIRLENQRFLQTKVSRNIHTLVTDSGNLRMIIVCDPCTHIRGHKVAYFVLQNS